MIMQPEMPLSVPPPLPAASPRRKPFKLATLLIFALLALVAVEAAVVAVFIARIARRSEAPQSRPEPGRTGGHSSPAPAQSGRYTPAPKSAPKPAPKPTGPRATPPQFSVPGGVFTNDLAVELRAGSSKAVIRYTLDGSEPEEGSPVYSRPIVLAQTTLVRARAFEAGLAPSSTASATYTKLDPSVLEFSSNLPLVIINSYNRYIGPSGFIPASVRFIGLSGSRSSIGGAADFDGRGDLKRRGYTSLRLPKPSFTFKARNDDGDKLKFSPFGLPAESDWVLYAPYQDKTLIRDVLAFELSNQMGRYAPRTRFVEVFLARGSAPITRNDNLGVYVLIEKIKRGKDRVNIAKIGPEDNSEPDISGGYIFKRDHGSMSGGGRGWGFGPSQPRATEDGVGFKTPRDLRLFFVDPSEDELTAAQRNWLARYVTHFEDVLHSSNFASPTEGYAKYLDVDAFIDHFWLVEMSKNIDAFRYSSYLHKPRNGKITLGPCWDWNLSFGNADYHGGDETQGWYYTYLRDIEICWENRLRDDPEFLQRQTDRWTELRREIFAPERILRRIDELAAQLQEAQVRNFKRWPILNRYVQPNPNTYGSYQGEIQAMKQWIQGRIAWIDRQFLAAPVLSAKSGAVPAGSSLTLSASTGKIYYTLDGTDPRARGGAPSKLAREYSSPLTLDREVQVFARVRRGDNWSGPTTARLTLEKAAAAR
jgi:hypothetical protein